MEDIIILIPRHRQKGEIVIMLIQLTEQQIQNLLVLLDRVQLTGQEAPAFMEILQAVKNPVKEQLNSQE